MIKKYIPAILTILLLFLIIGCAEEEKKHILKNATIHCSYMWEFTIPENATNEKLTKTAEKNIMDPIGLMYDQVNEPRYLNCEYTKKMVCKYDHGLDCWWETE
jgi:hypothetical protein